MCISLYIDFQCLIVTVAMMEKAVIKYNDLESVKSIFFWCTEFFKSEFETWIKRWPKGWVNFARSFRSRNVPCYSIVNVPCYSTGNVPCYSTVNVPGYSTVIAP